MSKSHRPKDVTPSFLSGEQRINKLLAAAGFGSRRQVDELITEGRVEIDGKTITQVGVKVNADESTILVDGEPLKRHKPVYYAVHKPAGVLCTNADPEGRPRVIDLVPSTARLFPVGRLDSSSTGLILLTNDGELAQRLAHPKHCVPKTYFVVVAGQVEKEAMHRLQRGIYLAEGIARVDGAKIRRVRQGCTEIDITLSEGKNREIRRVLARLGHKVVVLRRTAIGPLKLADMPEGSYRPLMASEVASLYQAVEDIKRARNQDRRERKKRADERAEKLASAPKSSSKKPTSQVPAVYNEDADWDEADDIVDSLPPMSQNPYRLEDDVEDDEVAGDDSILVSEVNSDEVFSNRKGAVISYDDDQDGVDSQAAEFDGSGFEDEDDDFDDFENALSSEDDEGDFEATSERPPQDRAPYNRGRPSPRGGRNFGGQSNGGRQGDRSSGGRSNGGRPGGDRSKGDNFRGQGRGSDRREGGFAPRGERREGGFAPRRERREGGFAPRGDRRESGFAPRGDRREGGFAPRGDRREGGFAPRGDRERNYGDRGSRREFSRTAEFGADTSSDRGGFTGDRGERGGFRGGERGPRTGGSRGFGSRGSGPRSSGPRSGGPREGRIEGGGPSGGRPGFGRPGGGRRPSGGGGGRPSSGGHRGGPGRSGGGRGRPGRGGR